MDTCRTCVFFKGSPTVTEEVPGYGVCMRYPQEIVKFSSDLCGEFKSLHGKATV